MIDSSIINLLISQTSTTAFKALAKSISDYLERRKQIIRSEEKEPSFLHEDSRITLLAETDRETLLQLLTERPELLRGLESPIEASRSTKEVITEQLTILEKERNRLTPI